MITREAIENYAEIQGGRCLEVFSMKEGILNNEDKKKYAKIFLDQRLQFHAEESKNLPLDKNRRVRYILDTYDLEALMLKWKQLTKKKSEGIGSTILRWLLGGLPAKVVGSVFEMDLESIDDDEKAEVVKGLVLVSLWNEAK